MKQTIDNSIAVTAQYDFCNATSKGEKLFSVRAGIPLNDAFEQLSMLLGSSIESINLLASPDVNSDDVGPALWTSIHLLEFTHALVQSMHDGNIAHIKTPVRVA